MIGNLREGGSDSVLQGFPKSIRIDVGYIYISAFRALIRQSGVRLKETKGVLSDVTKRGNQKTEAKTILPHSYQV